MSAFDTEIRFGSSILTIDPSLFAGYSSLYSQNLDFNSHSKVVTESSFATFIDYCQNRPCSINPSNAYELRYLAGVFGVPTLISDYESLKQISRNDVLISKLIVKSRLNSPARVLTRLMKEIAPGFTQFIENGQADALSPALVRKIMCFGGFRCSGGVLFNFLVGRFVSAGTGELAGKWKKLLECVDESELSVAQRIKMQEIIEIEQPPDEPPRLGSVQKEFEWQLTKLEELQRASREADHVFRENVEGLAEMVTAAVAEMDVCEEIAEDAQGLIETMEKYLNDIGRLNDMLKRP
jgi:hypothetical protein